LKSHAETERGDFETYLKARPAILECYSMSGEWDYLRRIVADHERFLMRQVLNPPNVAASASHLALSQLKYTTASPV